MLELKHISKAFKTKKVLVDINLSFDNHGFVAISGESGSGKSTLINIMSGIEASDSGELIYNGENLSFEKENDRIRHVLKQVAYMPQRQVLLNDKTVYENLKEILNIYNINEEEQIEIVLKQVHLNEKYKNRVVSTLSTGEAQRVCLAVSLLKKNDILILDEATENLDPVNREFIMSILKEISEKKLVILVTHDTFLAEKYVDRIITISNREIYDDKLLLNEFVPIEEILEEKEIVNKKRKRISLSFTNIIIYMLIPLIMIFFNASLSILISPNLYDIQNYPAGYFKINQDEKFEFTENEFRKIYEEEHTYFIFNSNLIEKIIGFIDYDFNYKTSKKITSYNEVIVSNTFLEHNGHFGEEYKILEIITNEKPVIILNYDLVLDYYVNDSKNVEALYEFYQEGGFSSDTILSTNHKKTLALNLPIKNCLEEIKTFMRAEYAMELNFGITICSIMISLSIALYIVFVNKQSSYYYNLVAFYKVCGQTNLEIRDKLKGKLYFAPIVLIVLITGLIHLFAWVFFRNFHYNRYVFRFDTTTYLVSFGISLFLLILLNELKNYVIFKSKLKKLIKTR
ncbi:MAG: ABC transporter ATP-binding protein [Roseburia sp.]|nr:ABC transporter ATP-binding protein [Anaeroplasma bactoclasticum]MCM1195889.1 ABC transporter ATP-binding protein [Roseburia sp.]MCM1556234.1 ABC transporter ATP-binding protein [Anaeroplasma bactoclasticum]